MRAIPGLLLATLFFFASVANARVCQYRVEKVSHGRLVANLFLPDVTHKVPVVIAVGGSEGGLRKGNANGEMMAKRCIAVIGIA